MSVPKNVEKQIKQMIDGFVKVVGKYLDSFHEKSNKAYFEFIKESTVLPSETISLVVQYPIDEENYIDVPYEFECSTAANVQFLGLPFRSVNIRFHFPDVLLGPNGVVPIIEYKVRTPRTYYGNIGLVWHPMTGQEIVKFYPYENEDKKIEELIYYAQEDLVDQFSDMLNHSTEKNCKQIREWCSNMLYGKQKKLIRYTTSKKAEENVIVVPVYHEYNEAVEISTIAFKSFAFGSDWVQPADVIMGLLRPFATLTKFFNDEGELMTPEEIKELEEAEKKHMTLEERRKFLKEQSEASKKKKKEKEEWDPFKVKQHVKRDAFGYVIDEKKGVGAKDTKTALERLKTARYGNKTFKEIQEGKKEKKATTIRSYASVEDFYEDNKGRRFKVVDNLTGLRFVDKGKVKSLEALNPPFMMQFAMSKLKINRSLTTKKAKELFYDVYKMGLLKEV